MEKKKQMKKVKARDSDTHTNIRVSRITKQRFDEMGKYGESADIILERLIRSYRETHTASRIYNYMNRSKASTFPCQPSKVDAEGSKKK